MAGVTSSTDNIDAFGSNSHFEGFWRGSWLAARRRLLEK
jgi:hypothetical protein